MLDWNDRAHANPRGVDEDRAIRDDLVRRLMPQPPIAWFAIPEGERGRRALYVPIAVLAGKSPSRAWALALDPSEADQAAIAEADATVSAAVLRRMIAGLG